jgi:hypothetical protein
MEKFVFVGTKAHDDNTELIDMLDGRKAAHGEEIELSESEVEQLKAGGVKLRSVGESDSSDDDAAEAAEGSDAEASASEEGKSGLFGSR